MILHFPVTNSGCLTWNIESLLLLCCLKCPSVYRITNRAGYVESIMLVCQSDGLLDFSWKSPVCVSIHCVVRVFLEIPAESRRILWTGSHSRTGYSNGGILLQITWDLNCGSGRRICGGSELKTPLTLNYSFHFFLWIIAFKIDENRTHIKILNTLGAEKWMFDFLKIFYNVLISLPWLAGELLDFWNLL